MRRAVIVAGVIAGAVVLGLLGGWAGKKAVDTVGSSASGDCPAVISLGTELSFTDTTVSPGSTCSYVVAAVNSVGEGATSNMLVATAPTAVPTPTPVPPPPIPPPVLTAFAKFVTDMQAAAYYAKWVAANCGAAAGGTPQAPTPASDAGKWFAFRDTILGGQRPPSVPIMATKFGAGLADAGWMTLVA